MFIFTGLAAELISKHLFIESLPNNYQTSPSTTKFLSVPGLMHRQVTPPKKKSKIRDGQVHDVKKDFKTLLNFLAVIL